MSMSGGDAAIGRPSDRLKVWLPCGSSRFFGIDCNRLAQCVEHVGGYRYRCAPVVDSSQRASGAATYASSISAARTRWHTSTSVRRTQHAVARV